MTIDAISLHYLSSKAGGESARARERPPVKIESTMASPLKISHHAPQWLLLSSSISSFPSTNRTVVNAPLDREPIHTGAVRLRPACSAAASDSGPAEPAKDKPKILPKKPVYSS